MLRYLIVWMVILLILAGATQFAIDHNWIEDRFWHFFGATAASVLGISIIWNSIEDFREHRRKVKES